jgi:hypothetical protein
MRRKYSGWAVHEVVEYRQLGWAEEIIKDAMNAAKAWKKAARIRRVTRSGYQ